jgi:hypothetical protein
MTDPFSRDQVNVAGWDVATDPVGPGLVPVCTSTR